MRTKKTSYRFIIVNFLSIAIFLLICVGVFLLIVIDKLTDTLFFVCKKAS